MTGFEKRLRELFPDRVGSNVPLAPLTTFKVGGPADWFIDVTRASDLRAAVSLARDAGVPVTVLGGGSNVLVSDAGVRGLVLRIHGGEVVRVAQTTIEPTPA